MKYLVVAPGYPSRDNIYANGFVHTRVKNYLNKGLLVDVFNLNLKINKLKEYCYEDVNVCEGNYKVLEEYLLKNKYDKILIHFSWKNIIRTVYENSNCKIIVWVHGADVLGWYRRLYNFDKHKPFNFLVYVIKNTFHRLTLAKFMKNKQSRISLVFVSKWMKNMYLKDIHLKEKDIIYSTIPNVVDNKLFKYNKKEVKDRLNILNIRSYRNKKYATDIMVDVILGLSKESFFNELTFNLYGDGILFDKILNPVKNFSNVIINRKFLKQSDIAKEHQKNGIMLIPTRQDAQGVSMCEAMASGLVVVTSNNTAIPEFINDSSGFLCNTTNDMIDAIKKLYYKPKMFLNKSTSASTYINSICDPDIVIKKEIELMEAK